MLESQWETFDYFKKDEGPFGFGDPSKMDYRLVHETDLFRGYIGLPVIVRCGTQGYHEAEWHELGLALDVLIDADLIRPLDLIMSAYRFGFTGIGFNPCPVYDQMVRPVAFHFDRRPCDELPHKVIKRRWIWTSINDEVVIYRMDEETLRKFGVLKWYTH